MEIVLSSINKDVFTLCTLKICSTVHSIDGKVIIEGATSLAMDILAGSTI